MPCSRARCSRAQYYIVDTIILLIFGIVGYQYTRTNQMVTQYHWLYERASLLSWKPEELRAFPSGFRANRRDNRRKIGKLHFLRYGWASHESCHSRPLGLMGVFSMKKSLLSAVALTAARGVQRQRVG